MKKFQTIITAGELLKVYDEKDVVIFDCRFYLNDIEKARKEFFQSHIPGATYLDLKHDLSAPVIKGITGRHPLPNPDVLAGVFRASGLNKHSQAIVYDQSNGAYAAHAWWLLQWLGHTDTAVLDGGFISWNDVSGAIDNQWTLQAPGDFVHRVREELIVERKDLYKTGLPIIDSREYIRYTGEYEPIDPVAGHIPGALCMPYTDNYDETGRWKSIDDLRKKFSGQALPESTPPVFYCGSGVTACHNILAYKMATGKDAKLYPGSWSEWINYMDKSKPLKNN